MPTAEELARQCSIDDSTSQIVYDDLKTMGLIYTLRGRGRFVEEGATELARQRCHTEIIKVLHQTAQEAKTCGMSKAAVKEIINAILKTDSSPYLDTPAAILKLAKKN